MGTRNLLAGAIVAASAAGAALCLGAGVASAMPDVVDRPYKDAKKLIQQAGGTPVIATRTGNGLSEGDCLVANVWEAGYPALSGRGRITTNNDVLVALNCNGELAQAGQSGNSAASQAGRAAKRQAQADAAEQEELELAQAATPNE